MLIRAHVVALRCNSSVREEAVGVAAVHEAMPFTDGVVLLSLQKTRKAGVDEIWHRGAWLCHCQGGAVDRPTFLPRLDVGVLRSKARPIAAVPLLHLAKRSKGAGRGARPSVYKFLYTKQLSQTKSVSGARLLRDVRGGALIALGLIGIDEHCISLTVPQHLHRVIVLRTDLEREAAGVWLVGAEVGHVAQTVCRRCPPSNILESLLRHLPKYQNVC